jgi:hypothetical protein
MVALGSVVGGPTNNVEIIDLTSTETICDNFPDYPIVADRAKGALGYQEVPLICGGVYQTSPTNECKIFENGAWRTSGSMKEPRFNFAITKSPFGNDTKLFLSGGYNSQMLATAEVLTKNGFEKVPLELPVGMDYHCMVMLNSTSIIFLGGRQDSRSTSSTNTFILNTEMMQWSNGPRLNILRLAPSCARIAKNSQETEQSVIVAGGSSFDGTDISSVEILDVGSNQWRMGPELPLHISGSAMVETPTGGVALIGGRGNDFTYIDTIFQLLHSGEDARWEELPQKLKLRRAHHTAFLVPDGITDSCSKVV